MAKYVYYAGHLLNTETNKYIYVANITIYLSPSKPQDADIVKRRAQGRIVRLEQLVKYIRRWHPKDFEITEEAKQFLKEMVLDLSKNL